MPVYMIIEVQDRNNETYSKYTEKVPEIISKYGGRYLILVLFFPELRFPTIEPWLGIPFGFLQ
jgi:hypothetical protein